MSSNSSQGGVDHTAGASVLGYLYQVEVALLELVRRSRGQTVEPGLAVSIETLDDVTFEVGGSPQDILQTKHTRAASLSDSSTDLWRTIKVWIDLTGRDEVDLATIVFSLMTTSTAPPDSAASFLRPDGVRDTERARRILERTASAYGNQSNKLAYSAFLLLTPDEQRSLLNAAVVLDKAPNIIDVRAQLTELLWHVTHKQFHSEFVSSLIGWWYTRVVRNLLTPGDRIIADEVDLKISDLREQFLSDNLPIDPEIDSISTDDLEGSNKLFVQQLQLIALESPAIAHALRDYKRAFYQRSEWTRQQLLNTGELERYESNLVDAWSFHHTLIDSADLKSEQDHQRAGLSVYMTTQSQDLFIRERCRAPWIMRGTYHMLADDLRVGWHPHFLESLRHLLPVV